MTEKKEVSIPHFLRKMNHTLSSLPTDEREGLKRQKKKKKKKLMWHIFYFILFLLIGHILL